MMNPLQALILGIVEGLTEFLPVSSTGHLILASRWLGMAGEGVKTFEVVMQSGALVAVIWLYRGRLLAVCRGHREGRRLLANLVVSFLPAAAAGLLLHRLIKRLLFTPAAVAAALAAGGLFMVLADRWLRSRQAPGRTLESVTPRQALWIGLAQVLAFWPGTSRAMVTLAAGMAVGLPAGAAAEYSFLLAIPTLGAATFLDAAQGGRALLAEVSAPAVALGFASAAGAAALAIRGFLRCLNRRGLAVFGWYRLALALAVWLALS